MMWYIKGYNIITDQTFQHRIRDDERLRRLAEPPRLGYPHWVDADFSDEPFPGLPILDGIE